MKINFKPLLDKLAPMIEKFAKTEIGQRLMAESPDFFKTVQRYAGLIVSITTILAFISGWVTLPTLLVTINGYVLAISGSVVAMCQFPKKDITQPVDLKLVNEVK